MLSKCANPSCSASFRYFHEGKLFRIETSGSTAGNAELAKPAGRVEFFWLCARCAPEMTVRDDGRGHISITPVGRDFREAS